MLQFQTHSFDQLSNRHLYEMLRLRSEVFVVEQKCIFLDQDNHDQFCYHVLGLNGQLDVMAYTRIAPPGILYEEPSIGRVLSSPLYRGRGMGKLIMDYTIKQCEEMFSNTTIKIMAQLYLEKFYSDFGFKTISEPFEEDEILHVYMVR